MGEPVSFPDIRRNFCEKLRLEAIYIQNIYTRVFLRSALKALVNK